MGNRKPIYRFSHHDLRDTTVLSVNRQENIIQHKHKSIVLFSIWVNVMTKRLMINCFNTSYFMVK